MTSMQTFSFRIRNIGLRRFEYPELTDDRKIRLVVLHPGKDKDDIHCHLQVVSLDGIDSYEALSYVWGDRQPRFNIRCSDGYTSIRSNLYQALCHLRLQGKDRVIWIDALCIDQTNVAERNSQVRLMGEIYSKASETVIWLGEETSRLQGAFVSIDRLRAIFPQDKSFSPEGMRAVAAQIPDLLKRAEDDTIFEEVDFVAIGNCIECAWFGRKWVCQEAAKSTKPTLMLGRKTMPWDTLQDVVFYMVHAGMWPWLYLVERDNRLNLHRRNVIVISRLRSGQQMSLMGLASSAVTFSCSDPRDHVIALLDLASDVTQDKNGILRPDYGVPAVEMFIGLVKWNLERKRALDFLSLCNWAGSRKEVPSWLPSLDAFDEEQALASRDAGIFDEYLAGGRTHPQWEIVDSRTLCLRGRTIGVIGGVRHHHTPSTAKPTLTQDAAVGAFRVMREWIQACFELAGIELPLLQDPLSGPLPNQNAMTDILSVFTWAKYRIESADYVQERMTSFEQYLAAVAKTEPITAELILSGTFAEYLGQLMPALTSFENYFGFGHKTIGRGFAKTEDGTLCAVHAKAKAKDVICVFDGAKIPYVLRDAGGGSYSVVGEAYVNGFMYGEAESSGRPSENIFLV